MSSQEILDAIPHRPPMLLVDEVVEREEQRIVCQKTFRADEYFFQGHYPDMAIVPGVILCESAMQAGAVLLSRFIDGQQGVPVATRLNDVKFRKTVRPGDIVLLDVTLRERLSDAFFLSAKVICESKVAARFEFACTMTTVEG